MAQTRTRKTNSWLTALEAERWDISYRTTNPQPATMRQLMSQLRQEQAKAQPQPVEPARDALERMKRDRLYFNAGRFAAGARDADAVEAFQTIHQNGTR